jgi:hypothetical protein
MTVSYTRLKPDRHRTSRVRVLVAFEEVRRVYRETIGRAIADLRPALEVRSVALGELEWALLRFDPHVVVCSQPNIEHPGGRGAWVEIPTDDDASDDARLAQVCLNGERWRTDGPTLAELLGVIDEAQERLREGDLTETC